MYRLTVAWLTSAPVLEIIADSLKLLLLLDLQVF